MMTTQDNAGISISTGDLAAMLQGDLAGPATTTLTGIETLENAGPNDLSFVRSESFIKAANASKAGAMLVAKGLDLGDMPETAIITVDNPDEALVGLLSTLRIQRFGTPDTGIHQAAVIHPSAKLHKTVIVGPNAVIESGVTIGEHTRIDAGAVISFGTTIGARCRVGANSVIGGEGFGYISDKETGKHTRLPHIGIVVIEDDVEIGAATGIDRAKFGITRIGQGTKIDNLVQVGHNVSIGKNCILCGLVGVAGSAIIEDGVVIGGQSGIADNITLGKGAHFAARSGVMGDVPPGAIYVGSPAKEHRQAFREFAALRRLANQSRKKSK
ncbi:MAG: UDP-3-O-(3-hydroxymyristoyl)glucosamine N-acyltransferase [Phycisphaera sp.]|nr:MAG: UDP-3-O-(3-hydroxymyristoyl)glucosamine N-acyltransferase [Phycisphaera sp.]